MTTSANPPGRRQRDAKSARRLFTRRARPLPSRRMANNGYTFTEWTGDLGNAPSQDVSSLKTTIVANFAQPQFTFNATLTAGNGTVDWTPKKNFYAAGEAIMVEAMADPGFAFPLIGRVRYLRP